MGADASEKQAASPALSEAEILACVDFAGMRDLLQNLRDMTGLSAAVFDRAGRVVVASDSTALCAMYLEEGSPSRQTCLENKREMARHLNGDEDTVIRACPLGLTECVSRIKVDGIHIANLMIGQFLTAAPDLARFAETGEACGVSSQAYADAVAAVPVVDAARLPAILRFLRSMAHQIARRGLAEARARAASARAEQLLADRTDQARAAESRLSRIAALVPGVLYQYRLWPDGRSAFPYASDGIEGIYGVTPDQVREDALPVAEVLHADDVDRIMASILRSARTLTVWREVYRVNHPTKGVIWVEGRSQPEALPDGGVLWHGLILDVTERVRQEDALRTSEAQFQALQENAPVAYLALDRDGRIIKVNAPCCALIGMTPHEITGRPVGALLGPVPEDAPGAEDHCVSGLLDGSANAGDLTLIRADGLEITVQVKAWGQNDGDGALARVHWIIHDITEHTRLEARLARSNTDLSQFAYAVSHDLREPLRMVGGFLGLIDRRLGADIDPEVREWMAFASDGAKRMNAMIVDLLEYSRAGSAEIEALPVSLTAVVDEALQNLTAAITERDALITVGEHLPIVVGDHPQLVRLIQNLVGNAVKFVPTEQQPEISITCQEGADATWSIAVTDNGPGIPADQRDQAFGVFQRLDAQRDSEGTGVGLALCKKIVERHGGTIDIDDGPTGGTVIRFTLPKRGLTWTQRAESRAIPIADLVNMLNMHQMRIVARMRNLSHTIQEREAYPHTAQGEAEFLVQEVEAYRVFVHAHGGDLFGERPTSADMDMLAEADSLVFSVRQWLQNHDPEEGVTATAWLSMSVILRQMLDHVRRTHDQLVRQRSQRVASSGDRLRH